MSSCDIYQNELQNAISSASTEFEKQVGIITMEAERDAKSLEDEAPEGAEIALGVDFQVDSKLTTWSMHLPTMKLVDKKLGSLDIPEVTMKDRDIIFHTPSTRMKLQVVSRYPEVKCKFRGIHTKCKTEWKEIKTHVPEVFMQKQKVKMGIPEVSMKRHDVIMGLPEFSFELVEFKFHVPVINIERVDVKTKEMEKKSKHLQLKTEKKIEDEKAEFKAEIIEDVAPIHAKLFDCIKSEAVGAVEASMIVIDSNIKSSEETITNLRNAKVPSDHESYQFTEKALNSLRKQKADLEQQKRKIIQDIENSEAQSLDSIIEGVKI